MPRHSAAASPSPAFEHHGERLLYRPEEAAGMLAISRTQLYELLRAGEIVSLKIGGRRRITPAALEDYIRRQAAA